MDVGEEEDFFSTLSVISPCTKWCPPWRWMPRCTRAGAGWRGAVIGRSGGVTSALNAYLCRPWRTSCSCAQFCPLRTSDASSFQTFVARLPLFQSTVPPFFALRPDVVQKLLLCLPDLFDLAAPGHRDLLFFAPRQRCRNVR